MKCLEFEKMQEKKIVQKRPNSGWKEDVWKFRSRNLGKLFRICSYSTQTLNKLLFAGRIATWILFWCGHAALMHIAYNPFDRLFRSSSAKSSPFFLHTWNLTLHTSDNLSWFKISRGWWCVAMMNMCLCYSASSFIAFSTKNLRTKLSVFFFFFYQRILRRCIKAQNRWKTF